MHVYIYICSYKYNDRCFSPPSKCVLGGRSWQQLDIYERRGQKPVKDMEAIQAAIVQITVYNNNKKQIRLITHSINVKWDRQSLFC